MGKGTTPGALILFWLWLGGTSVVVGFLVVSSCTVVALVVTEVVVTEQLVGALVVATPARRVRLRGGSTSFWMLLVTGRVQVVGMNKVSPVDVVGPLLVLGLPLGAAE